MKKNLELLLIISILLFLFFFIFLGKDSKENRNIIRSYLVSENQNILIDNWDCGATCPFQVSIYLQTERYGKTFEKELLSCLHISDVELSDITIDSAKIARLVGDSSRCSHKEGDIIYY